MTAHQLDLLSLVLTTVSQHQTADPPSKAVAQTEPEGIKTKPVTTAEKVITLANMREKKPKSAVAGKIEIKHKIEIRPYNL